MKKFSLVSTSAAEKAFRTDEAGRRVFSVNGPFSRPYIIPDTETEARLLTKLERLQTGFMIAPVIAFAILRPRPPFGVWDIVIFLVGLGLLYWVAFQILFRSELRALPRAETNPSLRAFYTDLAQRHSYGALILLLLGALGFVGFGVNLLVSPSMLSELGSGAQVFGWISILFFGACAAGAAYMLKLKS